jgi:hypothetical protein
MCPYKSAVGIIVLSIVIFSDLEMLRVGNNFLEFAWKYWEKLREHVWVTVGASWPGFESGTSECELPLWYFIVIVAMGWDCVCLQLGL